MRTIGFLQKISCKHSIMASNFQQGMSLLDIPASPVNQQQVSSQVNQQQHVELVKYIQPCGPLVSVYENIPQVQTPYGLTMAPQPSMVDIDRLSLRVWTGKTTIVNLLYADCLKRVEFCIGSADNDIVFYIHTTVFEGKESVRAEIVIPYNEKYKADLDNIMNIVFKFKPDVIKGFKFSEDVEFNPCINKLRDRVIIYAKIRDEPDCTYNSKIMYNGAAYSAKGLANFALSGMATIELGFTTANSKVYTRFLIKTFEIYNRVFQ